MYSYMAQMTGRVWDVSSTDEVEDGIVIARSFQKISERKGDAEEVVDSDRVNGFKLGGTESLLSFSR
jgi:hypothetical protein